jgi:nicotinate-nucleotide adenylyltransferase
VSDWELERPGPSYSWETVQHFRAVWPEAELHWIMGADQWAALERWARPELLRSGLTFVVFARDGERPEPRDGWRLRVVHGEWPVSSTAVREALALGRDTDGMLAPETADYIRRHRLYHTAASSRSSSMAAPEKAGSE